ncbi:porin [Pelomonas sp. UHG3]|uniref:Porin n=1 Tax=Roseateles hydrophilus TaxID=2975054 RepID=A0ACC6CAW5_9BURK|nr:porin [Pelomonas sp. UHG3]MCY4745598.1 porin [Pelomonas sp. UHG3]
MKKALIALAVLGLTGGAAVAQSSVTMFGVLDMSLRYTKANGQTLKQLANDGLNSSRLGVRGVEDLGGGLKAGFWLEGRINGDNGSVDTSRFWGRRTSVSLMGDFGEVRLGRGKTSTRLHIDDFDPYSTTGLGDVEKVYSVLGSASDTLNRSDNMVQYFLPSNLGGVYGSVDVAAGEGTAGKKMYGGRLGYKQGPINVAAALQETTGTGNVKFKQMSIGGSYDFGIAKPSLNYSQNEFGAREQKLLTFGLTVPLGQGQILASYTDAKANGAAESLSGVGDAKLMAASYVYNLSKRTALYTTVAQIKNSGLGRFALANSPVVTNGAKSSGFDVGVRHSF